MSKKKKIVIKREQGLSEAYKVVRLCNLQYVELSNEHSYGVGDRIPEGLLSEIVNNDNIDVEIR